MVCHDNTGRADHLIPERAVAPSVVVGHVFGERFVLLFWIKRLYERFSMIYDFTHMIIKRASVMP